MHFVCIDKNYKLYFLFFDRLAYKLLSTRLVQYSFIFVKNKGEEIRAVRKIITTINNNNDEKHISHYGDLSIIINNMMISYLPIVRNIL